jgi:hypothetical protein
MTWRERSFYQFEERALVFQMLIPLETLIGELSKCPFSLFRVS